MESKSSGSEGWNFQEAVRRTVNPGTMAEWISAERASDKDRIKVGTREARLPIAQVQRFERELLEMMELKHKDVLKEIAEKKDLSDPLTAKLHALVKEFVASFKVA